MQFQCFDYVEIHNLIIDNFIIALFQKNFEDFENFQKIKMLLLPKKTKLTCYFINLFYPYFIQTLYTEARRLLEDKDYEMTAFIFLPKNNTAAFRIDQNQGRIHLQVVFDHKFKQLYFSITTPKNNNHTDSY